MLLDTELWLQTFTYAVVKDLLMVVMVVSVIWVLVVFVVVKICHHLAKGELHEMESTHLFI